MPIGQTFLQNSQRQYRPCSQAPATPIARAAQAIAIGLAGPSTSTLRSTHQAMTDRTKTTL